MGEMFRGWLKNPNAAAVIEGYGLEGANDEVQTAIEAYVKSPSDNNAQKLAKKLGIKPLKAKHIGGDISNVVGGFGRVGGQDPLTYNSTDDHYRGGR